MLRRLLLLLLLGGHGCVQDYGDAPFACARTQACPEGYRCVAEICVREGVSRDAGRHGERPVELGQPRPEGAKADQARSDSPAADGAKPVVLHEDDFSGAVSSLTGDGFGLWSLVDGALVQQSSCLFDAWSTAIAIGKSWLDVEVAAKARIDGLCAGSPRSYAGVTARVDALSCELAAYYYCIVDAAGFLELARIGKGCKPVLASQKPLTTLPPLGSWVALSLRAVGGQLSCTLTGSGAPLTVGLSDPAPLGAGSAGVTASNAQARFDTFVVLAK